HFPQPLPPEPSLAALLVELTNESDSQVLRFSRTLKNQVGGLSKNERDELVRRLERWWPDNGVRLNLKFTDPTSGTTSYRLSAWLAFGPALDLPLTPERGSELATAGIVYGDDADWLQRHWTRAGQAHAISALGAAPSRYWASLIRATR